MEITISQNENQSIIIGNNLLQDINVNQSENQNININSNENQNIDISQPESQIIYIDRGEVAYVGITDVLVNGVTVVTDNIAYVIVPTKTSDLINDSGFLTSETDPTVPSYVKQITLSDISSWDNKQDTLVSGSNIKTINNTSLLGSGNLQITGTEYNAGTGIDITGTTISNTITSYNDLSDLPTIPTKTSDLINDNDFVMEGELAEVAFTGSYANLDDTPNIPAYTSELTNDSNFVSNTDYATNSIGGVIKVNGFGLAVASDGTLRGNAMTYANYQNTNNNSVVAKNTLENVITGKGLIDNTVNNLTNYMLTTDINTALGGKQDTLVSGTNIKTINSTSLLGSGDLTISGANYTAGTGISISSNVISTTLLSSSNTFTADQAITGNLTVSGYIQSDNIVYASKSLSFSNYKATLSNTDLGVDDLTKYIWFINSNNWENNFNIVSVASDSMEIRGWRISGTSNATVTLINNASYNAKINGIRKQI